MCDREIEATFPFLSFPFHYSSPTICARSRHRLPALLSRLQHPSLKDSAPRQALGNCCGEGREWCSRVTFRNFSVFLFSIGGAETGQSEAWRFCQAHCWTGKPRENINRVPLPTLICLRAQQNCHVTQANPCLFVWHRVIFQFLQVWTSKHVSKCSGFKIKEAVRGCWEKTKRKWKGTFTFSDSYQRGHFDKEKCHRSTFTGDTIQREETVCPCSTR